MKLCCVKVPSNDFILPFESTTCKESWVKNHHAWTSRHPVGRDVREKINRLLLSMCWWRKGKNERRWTEKQHRHDFDPAATQNSWVEKSMKGNVFGKLSVRRRSEWRRSCCRVTCTLRPMLRLIRKGKTQMLDMKAKWMLAQNRLRSSPDRRCDGKPSFHSVAWNGC